MRDLSVENASVEREETKVSTAHKLNNSNIELMAFSEQIMTDDHEIAPGIPT